MKSLSLEKTRISEYATTEKPTEGTETATTLHPYITPLGTAALCNVTSTMGMRQFPLPPQITHAADLLDGPHDRTITKIETLFKKDAIVSLQKEFFELKDDNLDHEGNYNVESLEKSLIPNGPGVDYLITLRKITLFNQQQGNCNEKQVVLSFNITNGTISPALSNPDFERARNGLLTRFTENLPAKIPNVRALFLYPSGQRSTLIVRPQAPIKCKITHDSQIYTCCNKSYSARDIDLELVETAKTSKFALWTTYTKYCMEAIQTRKHFFFGTIVKTEQKPKGAPLNYKGATESGKNWVTAYLPWQQ